MESFAAVLRVVLLLFCDSPAESLVDIYVAAVLLEVSNRKLGMVQTHAAHRLHLDSFNWLHLGGVDCVNCVVLMQAERDDITDLQNDIEKRPN